MEALWFLVTIVGVIVVTVPIASYFSMRSGIKIGRQRGFVIRGTSTQEQYHNLLADMDAEIARLHKQIEDHNKRIERRQWN